MRFVVSALALTLVVGCAPKGDAKSDSTDTAIAAVDTLKAAPTDTAQRDSTAPVSKVGTPTSTATKSTAPSQTSTKTAPQDSILGRDRAIQIDTKDPKRQIPTVDTSKKRP